MKIHWAQGLDLAGALPSIQEKKEPALAHFQLFLVPFPKGRVHWIHKIPWAKGVLYPEIFW